MTDTIVLLHGSATTAASWDAVASSLVSSGATVVAPDLLGYGGAPRPSSHYGIGEEVAHLVRELGLRPCSCRGTVYAVGHVGAFHLVAHSLGTLIALHLHRALGARVTRMTLVDPVIVSVLRETGEDAAYAEMEEQYQCFMRLSADPEEAARSDTATLAWLAQSPPPTTILVGENTLVVPRAVARVLAPALGATTVVVPGAGHMIPITHPQAVIDAVRSDAAAGSPKQGAYA